MIVIIGGGIAGLIAARNLETAGKECMIVEKNNFLGGRVSTDLVDGVSLDHGFQVLLTDYPYAQKYLNYEDLKLKTFDPGAVIYKNGKVSKFGDPVRDISQLFPTLFSWVGSIKDKAKMYNLTMLLKQKEIKAIFKEPEKSTLQYLQDYGFSNKIIENFFRPFFGGIFLESALVTSSRMFEFVFKMFGNGSAAIPEGGMNAIVDQLRNQLDKTKIILNTEASITEDGQIRMDNRIIKCSGIIKAYAGQVGWNGSTTFYFKVSDRILKGNIIGLLATPTTLINSFHYISDAVLSVTVVNENEKENIDLKVKEEISSHLGIKKAELIKSYHIPKSLPQVKNVGQGNRSNCRMVNTIPIVEAGDYLYYGSLNAAMHSGEIAAQTLLDHFSSDC